MMKNKKIIVIIFALLILAILLLFVFYKGTLLISPSQSDIKITIDNKKTYQVKDTLKIRLWPGSHKIKAEKEDYNPFEDSFNLVPGEKREIKINLTLTIQGQDKRDIEEVAKKFVSEWYTYQKQTDQEYLDRIKPFMTNYFYESTYSLNTRRKKDFEGQFPLKTTVSSVKILNLKEERAEVEVLRNSFEPTTNKTYEKKVRLYLTIENNKWLVNYLNPVL